MLRLFDMCMVIMLRFPHMECDYATAPYGTDDYATAPSSHLH